MDKRLFRSFDCPHDTSKRGKKRIYCFDYQQETKFSFVRTRFLEEKGKLLNFASIKWSG